MVARGGRPRIVGLFAYPDDETFCAGGTLARYASEGAQTHVVSLTRGEAGRIRDAAAATRQTLGRVRERELALACAELGVASGRCLDLADGTLSTLDPDVLAGTVGALLDELQPDVVLTVGADGAYTHPDHVAVGSAVLSACARRDGVRLYQSHYPRSRMLVLEDIASWLAELGTRSTHSIDLVHALSLFAGERAQLGYGTAPVDVRWFPAGSYIIEQGDEASSVHLVVTGEAEVVREDVSGARSKLARVGPGGFVGELGVAHGQPRAAHVIAVDNVTCLTLSAGVAAPGGNGAPGNGRARERLGGATTVIDVRAHVHRKLAALAAHRSQYPIDTEMLPAELVGRMFGTEYFVRVLPAVEPETSLA